MKNDSTDSRKKLRASLKKLAKLFFETLLISAFTFGGGYVIVSIFKEKFVDKLGWLSEDEMLDLMTLAQSCPGAMAVNCSVLLGYRIAGIAGALVTVIATSLPALVVISVVALVYNLFADNFYVRAVMRGMQAGIAAVIIAVTLGLGAKVLKKKRLIDVLILIVALVLAIVLHVSVVYILLGTLALGIIIALVEYSQDKKKAAILWIRGEDLVFDADGNVLDIKERIGATQTELKDGNPASASVDDVGKDGNSATEQDGSVETDEGEGSATDTDGSASADGGDL